MTKTEIPELPAELRRAAKISTSGYWAGVFLTAADEIERLRALLLQCAESGINPDELQSDLNHEFGLNGEPVRL